MKKKVKLFLLLVGLFVFGLLIFIFQTFIFQEIVKYKVKLEGNSVISTSLGHNFTLVEDQTANISSENLKINLTKITYQPCPKDVFCFWSGLGADFEVGKGAEVETGTTAVGSNINNVYFNYEVDLIDVSKIDATFRIEKCKSVYISNNNKSCVK